METQTRNTPPSRPLPRSIKNDARMELPIMLPTFDAIGMIKRREQKRARKQAFYHFCYEVLTGIWHAAIILFFAGVLFYLSVIFFDWVQL